MAKKRVLSGMRPTGALHMGNYLGALSNWVDMQDQYDCFFFVADWHALTSDYEQPGPWKSLCAKLYWIGSAQVFLRRRAPCSSSPRIPEHAELFLILSMITPVPWLERNPTYKDQIVQLQNKDLSTFGFLGYPVLQAADIIMYKAQGVPVGVDQVPHVEITREIARRFNFLYGPVFPEPECDFDPHTQNSGYRRAQNEQKLWQCHFLSDSPEQVRPKSCRWSPTPSVPDAAIRATRTSAMSMSFISCTPPADGHRQIGGQCRSAQIGCVDCKKAMAANLDPGPGADP
jgi:tryptophanyl-tRNA synthetase